MKARRRKGETKKQVDSRLSYERIVTPKKQYVNEHKLALGQCQQCGLVVGRDNVGSFTFVHLVRELRRMCRCEGVCLRAPLCPDVLFGRNGGVAGLVNNCSKAGVLDKVRHLLDEEMEACILLCDDCGSRQRPRDCLGRWQS